MISNLPKASSIGIDLKASVQHPTTTQEDNWKAARAAFDYPVLEVATCHICGARFETDDEALEHMRSAHPGSVMHDNDTHISGNTPGTNKEQYGNPVDIIRERSAQMSAIWALRVKYNGGPRRDIIRANMVNVLRQRGHDDDEIRRLLQVYDLL